jgi:hypothetical protein
MAVAKGGDVVLFRLGDWHVLTLDNAEALIKAKAFVLFASLSGHAEKISSNSTAVGELHS